MIVKFKSSNPSHTSHNSSVRYSSTQEDNTFLYSCTKRQIQLQFRTLTEQRRWNDAPLTAIILEGISPKPQVQLACCDEASTPFQYITLSLYNLMHNQSHDHLLFSLVTLKRILPPLCPAPLNRCICVCTKTCVSQTTALLLSLFSRLPRVTCLTHC